MRILIFALPLLLLACGGRPTQTLDEAQRALNGAILAKKCAPEEYAAAERMMAKANQLADDGKHDEAKLAAVAAKKLSLKAQEKANARKMECLKPTDPTAGAIDPNEFIDQTQADPNAVDPSQLETVYFDYNAFVPTPEAKQTMAKNASIINANPDLKMTLEGHCDSRGSTEFNLALGEKRALAVRKYLGSLGVDVSRLAVVSYGEEKPSDYGEGESAFARNRRVEFTIR